MSSFPKDIKIQQWFGDFGGSIATDTDLIKIQDRADNLKKILVSEAFDQQFEKNLALVLPGKLKIEKYELGDGRELIVAPGWSRYYNLAGQLAIAKLMGKEIIQAGTYSRNMAISLAKACKVLGFSSEITLSKKLSKDTSLVNQLKALGCKVDAEMCNELLDLPYAYYERAFFYPEEFFVVILEANYGLYPKPSMVGTLAGLYGESLIESIGIVPDCVAVPITTGTEAIGVFKSLIQTKSNLVTVEKAISQEFHVTDSGTYTLSTRNAQCVEMNTTLCPELVNWWRIGRVTRLGCDTLKPVDVDFLEIAKLTPNAARAASLAYTRTGCTRLLVITGEDR